MRPKSPPDSYPPQPLEALRAHLPVVDSTNSELLRRLQQAPKPPHGFFLTTDEQTAGRGQQGSRWDAPAGQNLLGSLALYPHFLAASELFYLLKAVAVGLTNALRQLAPGCTFQLKWPNDVLVGRRKVAGILLENTLLGSHVEASVVGIGLNVNQQVFAQALRGRASSLALAVGHVLDLQSVTDAVHRNVLTAFDALAHHHVRVHDQAYLAQLYRYQEWHRYLAAGEHFDGMIVGVTPQGKLAVQRQSRLVYFSPKDIHFAD